MMTYIKSGHFKNVANMEALVSFCQSLELTYNPPTNNLIERLKMQLINIKNIDTDINIAFTTYKKTIHDREISFNGLQKLSAKILHVLDRGNAAKQTIKKIKAIEKKIRGKPGTRSTSKLNENSIQQDFDKILRDFSAVIQLLSTETCYDPKENELKISGLRGFLFTLNSKNTAVVNSSAVWSDLRKRRNTMFYGETGMIKTANEVKEHINELYGNTNPQFKKVSRLKFNIIREENKKSVQKETVFCILSLI